MAYTCNVKVYGNIRFTGLFIREHQRIAMAFKHILGQEL